LALCKVATPSFVAQFSDMLGKGVFGSSLFVIGMFVFSHDLVGSLGCCGLMRILFARHVLAPTVMVGLALLVGSRGNQLRVMVLQSALPQAVVTFNISAKYGVGVELLTSSIAVGTLLTLPILLVWLWVLEIAGL